MAQFKAIDGFNSMDTKELTGYLYQLNEQLKYMFNNLTPDVSYRITCNNGNQRTLINP